MGAIAGLYNFDNINQKDIVERFKKNLSHRMEKINSYQNENFSFIQEQEIFKTDSLTINFDGNIYNYDFLKKKFDLKSNNNSELIYELYKLFDKNFFNQLEGSFIFSIYDNLKNNLILVRDQLGEKAVYYNYTKNQFVYSSEIKGILALRDFKRELNLSSMEKYFIFSYVPGEETMLKNIFELLPAYYIEFNQKGVFKHQYWDLLEDIDNKISDQEELKEKLNYLLNDSVKKRTDVNESIGLFLSGGIDSSLVAAIAQNQRKDKINTYSIHFGKEYPNELYYSSMVADHIKSNHQIVEVKPKNFLNEMFEIIKYLDDPIGDPITVPNFLLAQIASKDNKIVLNGEGGDPLFGGPKNISMLLSNAYSHSYDDYEIENYYLKSYKKCLDIIPSFFSEKLLSELKNNFQSPQLFIRDYLDQIESKSLLEKLMFINIKLKGTHHILVKVDKMTSANNINAIAPIFSPDISKFSFQIPPELKLNGKVEKYILKEAVRDILPHEVVYREKKGMMVPVKYWFQKDLKNYAKKILSKKNINEKGYFNYDFVKNLINYNLEDKHRSHIGLKLWMIITFEIWHKIFIEDDF